MDFFNENFISCGYIIIHRYVNRAIIRFKARERKPHMKFYKHILEHISVDPAGIIFVDDKIENVLPARLFGMHVFDNVTMSCGG